jgi:hypothetical protein
MKLKVPVAEKPNLSRTTVWPRIKQYRLQVEKDLDVSK